MRHRHPRRRHRIVLRGWRIFVLFAALLVFLPVAVWLDLRNVAASSLLGQARDLNAVITSIRDYYATHIVARVLSAGKTPVIHNYEDVAGAIPIPATLSLELGSVIAARQSNVDYRFVSDFPFKGRAPHNLDKFESDALHRLRQGPPTPVFRISGSIFDSRIRFIAPIIMGAACVACHNTHPDSLKRDWRVGDVRGIQELTITQPVLRNAFSPRYLLLYFLFTATVGTILMVYQRRQAAAFQQINHRLESTNTFLQVVSEKIAKYFPPQIYKRIFSGQRDVQISTERKKLTIFFSDIKDFTATTERLQPEELTHLLNEYLTEMSAIAARHGATVNKFIGDAMLVFFGDPESKGVAEDARDCVRMAVDMQSRLAQLNAKSRGRGVEQPFRVRMGMGINTGYCNVGNFGSDDRMDYTIIGAEANLAARLESIADPGRIVISYETYAVVRDIIDARMLEPIMVKGISRPIVPYLIEGLTEGGRVFSEHTAGLDLFLDVSVVDSGNSDRIAGILRDAIAALEAARIPAVDPAPELEAPTAT